MHSLLTGRELHHGIFLQMDFPKDQNTLSTSTGEYLPFMGFDNLRTSLCKTDRFSRLRSSIGYALPVKTIQIGNNHIKKPGRIVAKTPVINPILIPNFKGDSSGSRNFKAKYTPKNIPIPNSKSLNRTTPYHRGFSSVAGFTATKINVIRTERIIPVAL